MLPAAVKLWPTPRASAAMAENSNQVKKRVDRRGRLGSKLEESIAMNQTGTGGSLNPMWVEWLMGYPAGHTDLKDWEMLSSRKSQKK